MATVNEILAVSASYFTLEYEVFTPEPGVAVHTPGVFITQGNQLLGSYADLRTFVERNEGWRGWQAHHIVEKHDLNRLHIGHLFPQSGDQLCVLLPERAHIGRINSVLRSEHPVGKSVSEAMLLDAYEKAYDAMGDYCGGGKRLIRRELMSIVKGTFRQYREFQT